MGVTAETDLRLVESVYWLDAQTVQRSNVLNGGPRIQDIKASFLYNRRKWRHNVYGAAG